MTNPPPDPSPESASEPSPGLVRRYRRLLLAYPRWHRRLHGPDMLTALVDSAQARVVEAGAVEAARRPAPELAATAGSDSPADSAQARTDAGRHLEGVPARGRQAGAGEDAAAGASPRVPAAEAWGLVAAGVRARFRVRGAGPRLLAALVSLICATTLAAVAGWVGWRGQVATWPTVAQATALAQPVLPVGEPSSATRRDDAFGPWLDDADSLLMTVLGSPELRAGGVYLSYVTPALSDRDGAYAVAAERLRGSGWEAQVSGDRVVAERDGLRLTLLRAGREAGTDDLIVSVTPTPPQLTYRLAWWGGALGLLLGWLIAAAALARFARMRVRRSATLLTAIGGALLSLPVSLVNLLALVVGDADQRGAPPWTGYDVALARPGSVVGGVLLAVAWLLSATSPMVYTFRYTFSHAHGDAFGSRGT